MSDRGRPARVLDLGVALIALVALSPLLLIVGLAIRLTGRGPVLFRQTRIGRGGEPFTCFKFRTMRVGVDDRIHREYVTRLLTEEEPPDGGRPGVYKLVDDPRVTAVGRWLRRTSLDELPQLLNVVRGEMALVGPRPMLPWEVELLEGWQRERLSVRPGITGLWQVSGRSEVSVRDALAMDVDYVRRRNLGLDLRILARTPAAVLHPGRAA